MSRALITGASGQDGSYLTEFLLAKDYQVFCLVRRPPESMTNLQAVLGKVEFMYGDLRDATSLACAIGRAYPDEIYNLAAQSFVPPSWVYPHDTMDVNVGGLARILSIVERHRPECKVYQASSSEMYGDQHGMLNEESPMRPTSPYGLSKLAAHRLIGVYRGKGIRAVCGILFNHESERRGQEMVTMKICRHIARFAVGIKEPLQLGNLEARRDWGYAPEYVEAMWHIVQKGDDDYVIGTGEAHSVNECLDVALDVAGIPREEFRAKWLKSDARLHREGEIHTLCADATRARRELGWRPRVSFPEMVERMVKSETWKAGKR